MRNKITVTKINHPKPTNDWHGYSDRWQVKGPSNEIEKFHCKAGATLYARIRRKAKSAFAAAMQFGHAVNAL